jgi:hypothetical protein
MMMTRRRFLSATALAGAGTVATLILTRAAAALTLEPMSGETERLYLSACSAKDGAYHRQIVAQIKAELAGSRTDAEIEQIIAALTCPICGCPVTAG